MFTVNSNNSLCSFKQGCYKNIIAGKNTKNTINLKNGLKVDTIKFGTSKDSVVKRIIEVKLHDGAHLATLGALRDIANTVHDAGVTLSKLGSKEKATTIDENGNYKKIQPWDMFCLYVAKGEKLEASCQNPKYPKEKKERILDALQKTLQDENLKDVATKVWVKESVEPYISGKKETLD